MKKCLRWLPVSRQINQSNTSISKKFGFSLIELMIVIALVAIIALLAGSHMAFLERMIIRAELEHLYATCYMLQRSAMMLHQSQTLLFDISNNKYRYKKIEYSLPPQVRFGLQPGVKGPPSSADDAVTTPVTFKANSITFTPDGTIQPGAVYLTNRSRTYTYALSCAVAHVSYLRKYQYINRWVLL